MSSYSLWRIECVEARHGGCPVQVRK
jgi:hypothetical protein